MTEDKTKTNDSSQEVKNSEAAEWSLILAIATPFTYCLSAIPAILCAIFGLINIARNRDRLKGIKLAISSLIITPALAYSLYLFFLSMGMPSQQEDNIAKTSSLAHLKWLGTAMMVYVNENKEQYPTSDKWCDLLINEADVSPHHLINPIYEIVDNYSNYAINDAIYRCQEDCPADMVLLFESIEGWNLHGGIELLTTEYPTPDGANILFVNGHVEFIKTEDIPNLNWGTKQE